MAKSAASNNSNLVASIERWFVEHIKNSPLSDYEDIGKLLVEKTQVLKDMVAGSDYSGLGTVDSTLQEWKEKHLHNSPLSRNVAMWNFFQNKLEVLRASLK